MTAAAIISCALSGRGIFVSVGAGLMVGIIDGLINGLGVAFLRLPSMIWSLAMNSSFSVFRFSSREDSCRKGILFS